MTKHRPFRGSAALVGFGALALAYVGALWLLGTLTGNDVVDGSIGVLVGLYVCSQPAANAIDLLFFRRHAARDLVAGAGGALWITLNLLVLAAGWVAIWIGALRFVPPAR